MPGNWGLSCKIDAHREMLFDYDEFPNVLPGAKKQSDRCRTPSSTGPPSWLAMTLDLAMI
jgi:hypothetical protein